MTFYFYYFKLIKKKNFQTPEEGSRSVVHACISPNLEGCGGYYANCQPAKNLPYADDEETQKMLYDKSLTMVKHFLKVK